MFNVYTFDEIGIRQAFLVWVQWSAIISIQGKDFFSFSFDCLQVSSNYKFTSDQKEDFLIDSFSLFQFLCASMLFKGLILIKIQI